MRKEKKYPIAGATIGAFVFVVIDGIGQYIQLKEEGKSFWDNVDIQKSIKAGTLGLVLGGAIGTIVYKIQLDKERKIPFCSDNYMHHILNKYNIKNDSTLVTKAKKITTRLKREIADEFRKELAMKPLDFGSSKTKTAIGGSSDFDLLIPFKKTARPLTELRNEIYEFLSELFHGKDFELRMQKHSIGLTYMDKKRCIHFDIVPARERNNLQKTGDVTILRKASNFWENDKYVKSNIWKKRNELVNQPDLRRIIKLIKIYKDVAQLELNSPLITILAKEAFAKNNWYSNNSIYQNWCLVLGYIADQIYHRIKVKDPSNSNNNLIANMSNSDRENTVNTIILDLVKLEEHPHYLKDIFQL